MSIKILGIEVERKTDILALAAFVISISSIFAQTINLLQGPDVVLENPKQILFKSEAYSDGVEYLRISANLVYLNKGSPGYDDIIKGEEAFVRIGDVTFSLAAQDYVKSTNNNEVLTIEIISAADPVQVKSGGIESHETYFAPWPCGEHNESKNYISFSTFLSLIKNQDYIFVTVRSSTYDGEKLKTVCKLKVSQFIHHLESKKWSAPMCLK